MATLGKFLALPVSNPKHHFNFPATSALCKQGLGNNTSDSISSLPSSVWLIPSELMHASVQQIHIST